jgi:hypothetical protein
VIDAPSNVCPIDTHLFEVVARAREEIDAMSFASVNGVREYGMTSGPLLIDLQPRSKRASRKERHVLTVETC